MIKHDYLNQNLIKNLNEILISNFHFSKGMLVKVPLLTNDLILKFVKGSLFNIYIHKKDTGSAIYFIKNITNNDFYIGSTNSIYRRIYEHRNVLKENRHNSKKLQESFNNTSSAKHWFDITIIFTKDREEAYDLEQYLLNYYKDDINLCNTSFCARSNKGIKHTEITKEKMRNVYRIITDNHKQKISIANTGKINRNFKCKVFIQSDQHRQKVSESKKTEKNIQHCLSNSLKQQKPIILKGIEYPSISEASRKVGMNQSSIIYRLKSCKPHFKDDYYINEDKTRK